MCENECWDKHVQKVPKKLGKSRVSQARKVKRNL